MDTILIALYVLCLLVMAVVDFKIKKLPNIGVILILLLGVARMVGQPNMIINQLLGLIPGIMVFILYVLTRKTDGIGGGDVKLIAAMGLFMGLDAAAFALLLACLLCLIFLSFRHVVQWILKLPQLKRIALGPWLAVGAILVVLVM